MTEAAAAITAMEVTRHIEALAADSMRSRPTPSPGLERAAAYMADQFRQLGLAPTGNGRAWIRRYPIPGQFKLNRVDSWLWLTYNLTTAEGRSVLAEAGEPQAKYLRLDFSGEDLAFVREVGTPAVVQPSRSLFDLLTTMPAVLLTGSHTTASIEAAVRDKVVFYIPPITADSTTRQRCLVQLYDKSAGVVVVSDLDSARFATVVADDRRQPIRVVERFMREATSYRWPWAVTLRAGAMKDLLRTMGFDVAHLQTDTTPLVRPLPGVEVMFRTAVDTTAVRETAPNVVGILEGADPLLKSSYVVFSAHLDAGGGLSGRPDSLDPVADDNASGVAGLLVLAKAYSQPNVRPRRSLVFLATSGGAAGHSAWGSNAYLDQDDISTLSAVVNLARLGGTAATGDSLFVDGLRDVNLEPRPDWTAVEHPELRVIVADGGTSANPRAEYFPFVRSGLPTFGFHAGAHDAPRAGGESTVEDQAERTARFLRLAFYVGKTLADADPPPHWTLEGRRHFAAAREP